MNSIENKIYNKLIELRERYDLNLIRLDEARSIHQMESAEKTLRELKIQIWLLEDLLGDED